MAERCHVCGRAARKPVRVPVCGDADTKVAVCSARCRDEYLGGFTETREGRMIRFLDRPDPVSPLLAAAWLAFAAVHLLGPLIAERIDIPLLPEQRNTAFTTGGFAALVVAFALLRGRELARVFSFAIAVLGLAFAAIAWGRTGDSAWAVEALAFHPAVAALSLGNPGPTRVIVSLALFGTWPTAVVVTTAAAALTDPPEVERAAAESYSGRVVEDARSGLRLDAPEGWYVLRPESEMLPRGDAVFRALSPLDGLAAVVRHAPDCTPSDVGQVQRLLDALEVDGDRASVVGSPDPAPVDSPLGRGAGVFLGTRGDVSRLWYVVLLPSRSGGCVEVRCGGPERSEAAVRRRCVAFGARALRPFP